MAIGDFSFFHTLRVRWAEADMQGVVFNGHYLTYFDVGFTEYWRASGLEGPLDQAAAGKELFARKSSIEYLAPARFDDMLDIYVRCARLGNSSMGMLIEIHRQAPGAAQHLISGELVYVYADTAARRAARLPDSWRATLARFEKTAIAQ